MNWQKNEFLGFKGKCGVKNNRFYLVNALLYLLAGILFIIAAVASSQSASKVLFNKASVCFLISGIGFFCIYIRKRKKTEEKDG